MNLWPWKSRQVKRDREIEELSERLYSLEELVRERTIMNASPPFMRSRLLVDMGLDREYDVPLRKVVSMILGHLKLDVEMVPEKKKGFMLAKTVGVNIEVPVKLDLACGVGTSKKKDKVQAGDVFVHSASGKRFAYTVNPDGTCPHMKEVQ